MAKTVKVKLKALQFVHGERRKKGEIVELPETAPDEDGDEQPFAILFGDIVPDETPLSPDSAPFGGLHEAEDDE